MPKKIYSRKCLYCGVEFMPRNSKQVVCSYFCDLELMKKQSKAKYEAELEKLRYATKKDKSRLKREENAKFKQLKDKVKQDSYQKRLILAKNVFQAWIRQRDKYLPCISCGIKEATWNAGHYKKAEIYSGVIFDEINANKQCVYCNKWLDGNLDKYREGLVKKYGEEVVKDLEKRADESRQYKYTDGELKAIKKKYKIDLDN